jgi:hypothetical protein
MEIGEPVSVALTATTSMKAWKFQAEILEVTFKNSLKVSRKKKLISGPHWTKGEDVRDVWKEAKKIGLPDDSGYSKRAAALLVQGAQGATHEVEVKIQITESENITGQGDLTGRLGQLEVTGKCPTGIGQHVITARIKQLPEEILWLRGSIDWTFDVPAPGMAIALGGTAVELFFLLAPSPLNPFKAKGVWIEALRFLCGKVGVAGLKTDAAVAGKVTQYCHGNHRLRYDTKEGAPRYWDASSGEFALNKYMARGIARCNCYDQASAVQVLSAAVGTRLDWVYMDPYGFIQSTMLVGVGLCNNPFYTNPSFSKERNTRPDDPRRSPFGNHAFCHRDRMVLDACAGPHDGAELLQQYVGAAIDSSQWPYDNYNVRFQGALRPGTVGDMGIQGDAVKGLS